MAEPAVIRPTLALDTTIEFRFDPASAVDTARGPLAGAEGRWFLTAESLLLQV
jgi:hypothetical protein